MRTLHWFRNDLRLVDNTALAAACRRADACLAVFVIDDMLLAEHGRSPRRLSFMLDCLNRLSEALSERGSRLHVCRGQPEVEIPRLVDAAGVQLVTWNRDYGPQPRARDQRVCRALEHAGVSVQTFKDRVVWESQQLLSAAGTPYTVFTPFKRAWWKRLDAEPPPPQARVRLPPTVPGLTAGSAPAPVELGLRVEDLAAPTGGEQAARRRLRVFLETAAGDYAAGRDFPALDATSRLSPYLRFGVLSVRTCLRAALDAAAASARAAPGVRKWLDELIWRDFYHTILDAFPHVTEGAFRPEYDALRWENDEGHFDAWCRGRTGYPFVDAAMRQLNETGWMHNRARMVVASFLTKDLLVDWRWGERYFMERLVDGDPAANNGGWQWAASTGTDAQPYFRIFNPVIQGERFDPQGAYVRQWVPELSDMPAGALHSPWRAPLLTADYPAPIVDHARRRRLALARYKAARGA